MQNVAESVENIRQRIAKTCAKAGRRVGEVTLVAVSKTFGSSMIREAVEAGVVDIGENFVQELVRKRNELGDERIRWHFVGHLQTNKVKHIAGLIHLIHSIDSLRLGEEIARHAERADKKVDVLVEVNTTGEATKYGVKPEEVRGLVEKLSQLSSLCLRGLMTIGPFPVTAMEGEGGEPEASPPSVWRTSPATGEASRQSFQLLREVRNGIQQQGFSLPHLSMGMTDDFEVAIEEGATIVRIGTAIFGKRTKQED